jgi:hypothetical protein
LSLIARIKLSLVQKDLLNKTWIFAFREKPRHSLGNKTPPDSIWAGGAQFLNKPRIFCRLKMKKPYFEFNAGKKFLILIVFI